MVEIIQTKDDGGLHRRVTMEVVRNWRLLEIELIEFANVLSLR